MKATRIANFYRSMGPTFQVIGQLFKAIDRDAFAGYESVWNDLVARGGLANIHTSHWQVFATMALVHELTVGPHIDDGDLAGGWVAMFVRGRFTGGDLVVPALGIKVPYQQGDLVFMRSSELEHYIDKWDGSRTGVVMFTKGTTVEKRESERHRPFSHTETAPPFTVYEELREQIAELEQLDGLDTISPSCDMGPPSCDDGCAESKPRPKTIPVRRNPARACKRKRDSID